MRGEGAGLPPADDGGSGHPQPIGQRDNATSSLDEGVNVHEPVVSGISTTKVKASDPGGRGLRHHVGMLDPQAIGRRLVELRRATDIVRQEDLAAIFGISRSTIAGIEAGGDLPGRDLAVAMANYFRVPLDWLLCRTVPPGGPQVGQFVEDGNELALLGLWRNLSHEQRVLLMQMLRNIPKVPGAENGPQEPQTPR